MRYLVIALIITLQTNVKAGGIEFFHGTWEEAVQKAADEEKVIFVDAFTTWCGPCKKMARTVFTDDEVGDFFNANFVNLKLDMEKKEGIAFQHKYPVSAFPTLYFIDGKEAVVQKVKGAQNKDGFLSLGKSILSKMDNSGDFAAAYEAGDRDPAFIHKYVKALIRAGKPSGKIANAYLRSQENLKTAFNRQFLFDALAEADTRIFTLFVDDKSGIVKQIGAEKVDKKIRLVCERTLQKAILFKSEALKDEAISKAKKQLGSNVGTFELKANMDFAASIKDEKGYLKAAGSFGKKIATSDTDQLLQLSKQCKQAFPSSPKALSMALSYAESACKSSMESEHHLYYAQLLLEQKDKSKALEAANKALELCKGNPRKEGAARKMIKHIEHL